MRNLKRYSVFILGLLIITLGVSLMSKGNIGTGSWDAINFGLSKRFGRTPGFWIVVSSLVVLVLAAIIEKKGIKFTSFITATLLGVGINLWGTILNGVVINNMILKVSILLLGLLLVAIGLALYLITELPQNPIDYLMVVIKEKLRLTVGTAKLLVDITCIFIAIFIGGPIGIGTIIASFFLGPCVNIVYPRIERIYRIN